MPHKFNADRRHKIAKQKFKFVNWSAYNESLRQRGDLTVWVSEEALSLWTAARRISRGGQPKYSDLAGFIADDAYDGVPTRDLLAERFGEIVRSHYPASQDRGCQSSIGNGPICSRPPHRGN